MMTDPYKVLGVSPGTDKDEIKKAYRALAKKYHPDSHPGDKVAEQKMKEINAAYDSIMNGTADQARGGGSSYGGQRAGYGGGYGGFGGFGGFGGGSPFGESAQESDPYLRAAQSYIYSGYYDNAINTLNQMDPRARNAKWYYYGAMAHYGAGNSITARQYAQQAVNMEPDNAQYRNLLENLQNPGMYRQSGGPFMSQNLGGFGIAKYCLGCIAMNLLCRFCYCC